jgi:protein-tyrosine phosphatase
MTAPLERLLTTVLRHPAARAVKAAWRDVGWRLRRPTLPSGELPPPPLTLVFVCKGNICRSPFAEGYARRTLAGGVEVRSAGYYPKNDRPCPDEAVRAAREAGIDLAPHRSALLGEDALRRADAVFVFDRHNWRTVVERFPFARPKLHLLGDLAGNRAREIRDPYGGTLDDFRAAYRRISGALDAGGLAADRQGTT